jgi:hypothetical protein
MNNGGMGGAPATKAQPINKGVKTIRLHWRETAPNMMPTGPGANDSLWTSLNKVKLDTDKLAQLFELKQSEVKLKVNNNHPILTKKKRKLFFFQIISMNILLHIEFHSYLFFLLSFL